MNQEIYLDNGTATHPSDRLIAEMQLFAKRHWQSIIAPYIEGKEPFTSIDRTLRKVRDFIGATEEDFFLFCSCGTDAISKVYHSVYVDHIIENGKNHILTTSSEEQSMYLIGQRFEKFGLYQRFIPLNNKGEITIEALEKAITPKTGLVSLSSANGLTGVIQPIAEIGEICRKKKILFHVDASNTLGKMYFTLQEISIDYLTFDGTLLHGPKGSGGLFVHRRLPFPNYHAEEGFDLNLPAFIGLGIAMQERMETIDHICTETVRLRNKLEEGILLAFPSAQILFKQGKRLPNTSLIIFPKVMSELLTFYLREQKIFPSLGGGRLQKLSDLLTRMGQDPTQSQCALSFSLSHLTTEEEIDRSIGVIIDCFQQCQRFSQGVFS